MLRKLDSLLSKLSLKTRIIISLILICTPFLAIFVFTGTLKVFVANIYFTYFKIVGILLLVGVLIELFLHREIGFLRELFYVSLLPIVFCFITMWDMIKWVYFWFYYKIFPNKHPDVIEKRLEESKKLREEQYLLEKEAERQEKILKAEAERQGRILEAGRIGEELVEIELKKIPNTRVLKNVYVPIDKDSKKYTEVDIIAINKGGIYAIEVKNYNGTISGDKESYEWTKTTENDEQKFYNPLMQNESHKKALKKHMNAFEKNVMSLIIFGDKSDISAVRSMDPNGRIINISEIRKTIAADIYGCPIKLTEEDIEYITNELQKCVDVDDEIKKEHLEYVKNVNKKTS